MTPTGRAAPAATNDAVRRRMQAMGRRDTTPELALRRELHRRGLRYRVDHALPAAGPRRRADIVFTRARLAVYVDGCFWHGCPEHGTRPRTNSGYWNPKIDRNQDRDRDTDSRLEDAGWAVVRVWEHEDPQAVADRVQAVLSQAADTAIGDAGSTRGGRTVAA